MSAPVTDWPLRIVLVLLVVAAIVGILGLMRWGWRRRAARQADIPAPPSLPAELGGDLLDGPVDGLYLGTVSAGDWLDRIVVHGLGVRSQAGIRVGHEGIVVDRVGAPGLWIPIADIEAVRSDRGIAGRAYEKDGVVIVTWRLGGRLVDTGLRARRAGDQAEILSAVTEAIIHRHPDGHHEGDQERRAP